jgi:hypothetical protein
VRDITNPPISLAEQIERIERALSAREVARLLTALESVCPGRKGGGILYDEFRNGFAHLRGPKSKFAIAEDHELSGDWADMVEVNAGGQFVAINIDRLAGEFLRVLGQL